MQYFGLYSRVLNLLKPERNLALGLCGAAVFLGLSQLLQILLLGWLIQNLSRNLSVATIIIIWLSLALMAVAASLWLAQHAGRLAHRARLRAMADFFEQIIASVSGLTDANESEVSRLMQIMLRGADQMFFVWHSFFRDHLPAVIMFLVSVPLAFFINWKLALVLFALLFTFASLSLYLTRAAFEKQGKIEPLHAKLAKRAADSIGHSMTVQAYGRLKAEVTDLNQAMQELLSKEYTVVNWWARRNALLASSAPLLLAIISAFGSYFYYDKQVNLAHIIIFAGLSFLLTYYLGRIINVSHLVLFETGPIHDFLTLLDTQSVLKEKPGATELNARAAQIEFRDIIFRPAGHTARLHDFSLTVMPGERVAFIDADGGSLTFIASLLLRLLPPLGGDILIDDQNIADVQLASLRRNITLALKEPGLFQRSVMENLKVGNPHASQSEIINAVKKVDAHEFIAAKPEGFHTLLCDDYFNEEERQRIALARALLKKAPILIFEDIDNSFVAGPTYDQAVTHLLEGRTALIFSQRETTLRKANRIAVIKEGSIAQIGSYDEIIPSLN